METSKRKRLIWLAAILGALVALYAWLMHGNPTNRPITASMGKSPTLPEPDTETFPTLGLAKPIGWGANEAPQAAAGLQVTRFADGLDHPRTMLTLPNGDVIVAETNSPGQGGTRGLTGLFMKLFMSRVGAATPSPNRLTLLRDSNGDGKADARFVLREGNGLESPSGLAWAGGKLMVANHNGVVVFDFQPGETVLKGEPKLAVELPPGGNHWMRGLKLSPDNKQLYISVGSASNIAENGTANEVGRAAIVEYTLGTGQKRQYAGGLRNPNAMDWNPSTGELWTVVNERDMLSPDAPPDYLTNVPIGAQYGWPWLYWGKNQDWRVREPLPDGLYEYTRKPEYALGAHVAPLGMVFSAGGNLMGPGRVNGAFIARHGSWNRKPLAGYDVIFVPFDANGNPAGAAQPVLTGFLARDGRTAAHGRPVWLAFDKAGALLVSDDTGGAIWRVSQPGATPSMRPAPVRAASLPPVKRLVDPTRVKTTGSFKPEEDQALK